MAGGGFVNVAHNEAPMASGPVDARAIMDGSGWTVSTGSSRATGGARTQSGEPYGSPAIAAGPFSGFANTFGGGFGGSAGYADDVPVMSAGYGGSGLTLLAAGGLVLAVVLSKKKGG